MGMERKMKTILLVPIWAMQVLSIGAACEVGFAALSISALMCSILNLIIFVIESYRGKIETVYLSK